MPVSQSFGTHQGTKVKGQSPETADYSYCINFAEPVHVASLLSQMCIVAFYIVDPLPY